MRVAIIGSRNRASVKDFLRGNSDMTLDDFPIESEELKAVREKVQGKDKKLLAQVIDYLEHKYRRTLTIISVGCDDGVGWLVREQCEKRKIWFAEISIHFKGERRPKADYSKFYLARNATVSELADMFVILASDGQSIAQDLLDRIKTAESPAPFIVYNDEGKVLESNYVDGELISGKARA